jgi:hypothetical protein
MAATGVILIVVVRVVSVAPVVIARISAAVTIVVVIVATGRIGVDEILDPYFNRDGYRYGLNRVNSGRQSGRYRRGGGHDLGRDYGQC